MEFCFSERNLSDPLLPDGFEFVPWKPVDLERHAWTKFRSFQGELDARLFPCLASLDGCRRLMQEIAAQKSFLSSATWLITRSGSDSQVDTSGIPLPRDPDTDCATIQGLANSREAGSVQNVGVALTYRGLGLGRALLVKALHGFRDQGLRRVYLEATAENVPAVELYRSVGFRLIRTSFRELPDQVANSTLD